MSTLLISSHLSFSRRLTLQITYWFISASFQCSSSHLIPVVAAHPSLVLSRCFLLLTKSCRGLVRYAFRNDTCSLLIKVSPAVPWQRLHPQLSARSWHLQNCWAMNLIVKLALIACTNIWLPQALHSRNPVDIDLLTCWDHAWSSVVGVLACFRCIFVRPGRNLSYRLYNTVYNCVYI